MAADPRRAQLLARPSAESVTVRELLDVCEAADDQDTGSLDAFRETATVGVVAMLARFYLAARRG